jgi:hypothetical protein
MNLISARIATAMTWAMQRLGKDNTGYDTVLDHVTKRIGEAIQNGDFACSTYIMDPTTIRILSELHYQIEEERDDDTIYWVISWNEAASKNRD